MRPSQLRGVLTALVLTTAVAVAEAGPAFDALDAAVDTRLAEAPEPLPRGKAGRFWRKLAKVDRRLAADLPEAKRLTNVTRLLVGLQDDTLTLALGAALDEFDAAMEDLTDDTGRMLARLDETRAVRRARRKLGKALRMLEKADGTADSSRAARWMWRAWRQVAAVEPLLDKAGVEPPPAGPDGAIAWKSGPVQITPDGAAVFAVHPDNHSVSRYDTVTREVVEFPLPGGRSPRGLSLAHDSVWVACHDTDEVLVLSATDGSLVERVQLPWGSGPHQVAIDPTGEVAVVTLFRASSVAVLDVASRTVREILTGAPQSPLGITWTGTGGARGDAIVTHLFVDEHPPITRVEVTDESARFVAEGRAFATDPRASGRLAAPFDVAEGGYLSFRGHPARHPVGGRAEVWLPTQYSNIHEDRYSPDSTIQATVRRLDLTSMTVPNDLDEKVILSARFVHDPTRGNAYVGPGWDARVAGPIDMAFSADGALAYLVFEQSNDLLVLPTSTTTTRPSGAAALTEIDLGDRPIGMALAPTGGLAYVLNRYSRDLSVVDLGALREIDRIPLTPTTGEPLTETLLTGARLFHTSDDPRVSGNQKVSCASCHIDGEHDGRSWDFQSLPGLHGPRSTPSMLTLSRTFGPRDDATGFGQLHRSGDRDEIQDFEHTFRGPQMGGTGFLGGGVQAELGAPNAGRDADLDAVAAYLLSLEPPARSPHRNADGSLSDAAVRGATYFLAEGSAPAAANCATCHVPETGFVDGRFHDVGQRRPGSERELNDPSRGAARWKVNTPTLIGVWATPGYDGVSTWASTLVGFLEDVAGSSSHGRVAGLTGRQRLDLAEFVASIDGDLTAEEIRAVVDDVPPHLTRVEAPSSTRIVAWFSEGVDPTTATDPSNWALSTVDGTPIPVTSVELDTRLGDRATLTTTLPGAGSYRLAVTGVRDLADTNGVGTANITDAGDPRNSVDLALLPTPVVRLGASSDVHVEVRVHDSGVPGPNLSTWNHDRPTLARAGNGITHKGFVRFDWRDEFVAATGVDDPAEIESVRIRLVTSGGVLQTVEARRCLQPWLDPPGYKDWNSVATGAPTWRDHSHPDGRWNRAGADARTQGVDGDVRADYQAGDDIAFTADASAEPVALYDTLTLEGPRVTDAFRFWFENPDLDFGYALELAAGERDALLFHAGERDLGAHAPVLEITYRLPE